MNFKHLMDETFAIDFLADYLSDGSLVLFLGAGTSRGFGLPDWLTFANGLREKAGLPPITKVGTPEDLQNGVDEALDIIGEDSVKRLAYTKEILYPDLGELKMTLALDHHLLVALSSLLMGSRRGHVNRVVTYNYDSMLEWFLMLFGFEVNSISSLPAMEGSEDVRIYHPHGFAPHPLLGMKDSSTLVLGLQDANIKVGDRVNLWVEKERQMIETGMPLFIGMSGHTLSDRAIGTTISSIAKSFGDTRPLGLWIYLGDLPKEKEAEYLRNKIVPIVIKNPVKIPEFILKIAQKALEKQKKTK